MAKTVRKTSVAPHATDAKEVNLVEMFGIRSPLANELCSLESVDVEMFHRNVLKAKFFEAMPATVWVFEGIAYTVNLPMIHTHVQTLANAMLKNNRLTVADVYNLPLMFARVPKDAEGKSPSIPPISSYPVLIHWPSVAWPVVDIAPGLVIAMGDTGSGKTTFIDKSANVDFIVRFGEPLEAVDYETRVIPASSFFHAVQSSVILSILGFHVAVDSLRALVYGLDGAAMEGGIIAAIFDAMTQLNNVLADMGVTVIMAVNPMLSDSSKMDRLAQRLAASVAGLVHLRGPGAKAEQTFRLTNGRIIGTGYVNNGSEPVVNGKVSDPANTSMYFDPKLSELGTRGEHYFISVGPEEKTNIHDGIAIGYQNGARAPETEAPRPTAAFTL